MNTESLTMELGLLIRNDIIKAIKVICALSDVSCAVTEGPGFLSKLVVFNLRGESDNLSRATFGIKAYLKQLEEQKAS